MKISSISGLTYPVQDLDKTAFLVGPFYYYCLVLLTAMGFVMWRIVGSPFGLHLMAIRENRRKAEYLACARGSSVCSRSRYPRSTAPSAA